MSTVVLALALSLLGPAEDAAARAKAAYDRGDYEAAAAALADAYEADPQPAYLYARAQAERYGGDCAAATEHYRAFLDTKPGAEAAKAAQTNLDECEAELAAETPEPTPAPTPTPTPTPTPAEPGPETSTPDTTPLDDPSLDREPWYRDKWGTSLVAVGAIVGLGGAGVYGAAIADRNSAESAGDVDEYGRRIERASTLSRVGIGLMAGGGAVLVAGAIRWIVVSQRGKQTARRVSPTGTGLAVRF